MDSPYEKGKEGEKMVMDSLLTMIQNNKWELISVPSGFLDYIKNKQQNLKSNNIKDKLNKLKTEKREENNESKKEREEEKEEEIVNYDYINSCENEDEEQKLIKTSKTYEDKRKDDMDFVIEKGNFICGIEVKQRNQSYYSNLCIDKLIQERHRKNTNKIRKKK